MGAFSQHDATARHPGHSCPTLLRVLAAAAFAPHPPLILPEVAAGAAAELDGLRAACDDAVGRLLAARPGLVVVVGGGPAAARWTDGDGGSLAGYGVDVTVPLCEVVRAGRAGMPLSVTIGAWLLHRAGYAGDRLAFTVPTSADAADLARWAADLADLDYRLGLLVMGDGSARRSENAPGYVDPRAGRFDEAVAVALGRVDAAALRVLDPLLGAELLAAGVAPWRLAGHVAAITGADGLIGLVRYHEAPYGVGYIVASWGGPP
jgi:hypothetical protein